MFDNYHSYRTPALPATVTDPLKVRVDDEENAWFLGGDEFESWFRVNRGARVTATIVDDEGHAVRTLYDDQAPAGEESLTWDGRGDDRIVPHECEEIDPEAEEEPNCDEWLPGDPLPTGDYELRIRAADGGETVTATQPVRLERRPAGELVTPRDGDTLSRHQSFVVRVPDDYPEQPFSVLFCLGDECEDAARGEDGVFRTAIDTTGMDNGETELEYTVRWGWMEAETGWQVTRRWTGHATVTISDIAPEVTLSADPAHGDVPLASALKIDANDSVGPLAYTLNFGDGTPAQTGTIEPPYDELVRPHTYTQPGVHHAHVMVTDQDGTRPSARSRSSPPRPPSPSPPPARSRCAWRRRRPRISAASTSSSTTRRSRTARATASRRHRRRSRPACTSSPSMPARARRWPTTSRRSPAATTTATARSSCRRPTAGRSTSPSPAAPTSSAPSSART